MLKKIMDMNFSPITPIRFLQKVLCAIIILVAIITPNRQFKNKAYRLYERAFTSIEFSK